MATSIERLQSQPDMATLEQVLAETCVALPLLSRGQQVALATAVVAHTVPEAWHQLAPAARRHVATVLLLVPGVGTVLLRLELAATAASDQGHATVRALMPVLAAMVRPGWVAAMVAAENAGAAGVSPAAAQEIGRLVFLGRCVLVANQALAAVGESDGAEAAVFGVKAYARLLLGELCGLQHTLPAPVLAAWFRQLLVFHPDAAKTVLEHFVCQERLPTLLAVYAAWRPPEQRGFVSRHLVPRAALLGLSVGSTALLLLRFAPHPDLMVVEAAVRSGSTRVYSALGVVWTQQGVAETAFARVLADWARPRYCVDVPVGVQEQTAVLMAAWARGLLSAQLEKVLRLAAFLDGISTRLGSFLESVKRAGMWLADRLCEVHGDKMVFGSGEEAAYRAFWAEEGAVAAEAAAAATRVSADELLVEWEGLPAGEKTPVRPEADMADTAVVEAAVPSTGPSVVPSPVYIHDLLGYLASEESNPQAYDRISIALATGPTLIRQKAAFGTEVRVYAVELASTYAGLQDRYRIPRFAHGTLHGLVALVAADPGEVVPHLIRLLLGGDYLLQQRMQLLSAMSLGARELRGFHDEVVEQAVDPEAVRFPSSRLPGEVEARFSRLGLEDQNTQPAPARGALPDGAVFQQVQAQLVASARELAEQSLVPAGRVVRVLQGLRRAAAPGSANRYAKLASPVFVLPLVLAWHRMGGRVAIGHYLPLLAGHFVKTLALLVHAAHPTASGMGDMVLELLLVAVPAAERSRADEVPVVEACLTAVLVVVECYDHRWLAEQHGERLARFQLWAERMASHPDPGVRGIAAAVVVQLSTQ